MFSRVLLICFTIYERCLPVSIFHHDAIQYNMFNMRSKAEEQPALIVYRIKWNEQEVKVIWQKAPHGGPFPG